jgi:hypothetical protein
MDGIDEEFVALIRETSGEIEKLSPEVASLERALTDGEVA